MNGNVARTFDWLLRLFVILKVKLDYHEGVEEHDESSFPIKVDRITLSSASSGFIFQTKTNLILQ